MDAIEFTVAVAAIEIPEDIGKPHEDLENDDIYDQYLELMHMVELARAIARETSLRPKMTPEELARSMAKHFDINPKTGRFYHTNNSNVYNHSMDLAFPLDLDQIAEDPEQT